MTKQEILDLLEERRRFYEEVEKDLSNKSTARERSMGEGARWACELLIRDIERMEIE